MNVARLHRLLPVAALAVLSVFMSMVTRTALAWLAGAGVDGGPADWLRIAAFGLLFDAVAAFYLVTPLAAWLLFVPDWFARTRLHRFLILLSCL